MKSIHLFIFLIQLSMFINYTSGFCLGMFCAYMPFMAKSCCSVVKKCCGHYQAWLSPLATIDDNPDDYLEALTHEMIHDNLGPSGFFESDVHRYPGVFNNINRFYKRHSRRSDNEGLDTKNGLANSNEKLNKLESIQLNNLNSLNNLNNLNNLASYQTNYQDQKPIKN